MGKLWFFDSGIGGLQVMNEFRKFFPELDMEYFGDSKNCPYGDRPSEEIRELVNSGVESLVDSGCTIIILACNTAVAQSIRYLQEEKYPKGSSIKILWVTLPGVEKVIESRWIRVGVLATQSTIRNGAYRERIHKLNRGIDVTEVAIPGLVDRIEETQRDNLAIERMLTEALLKFQSNTEAMVLWCTHYPIVEREIRAIWKSIHKTDIEIVDPGKEAARRFGDYMKRHPEFQLSKWGTTRVFFTCSKT